MPIRSYEIQQNHWSEWGRTMSLVYSERLGRPHRSVLALTAYVWWTTKTSFADDKSRDYFLDRSLCRNWWFYYHCLHRVSSPARRNCIFCLE